jgi:hypothetical protein
MFDKVIDDKEVNWSKSSLCILAINFAINWSFKVKMEQPSASWNLLVFVTNTICIEGGKQVIGRLINCK